MELTFHGANCIRIVTKQATVVVDDNLAQLDSKSVTKEGNVTLQTFNQEAPKVNTKICIDQPGEYETSDVSIVGVAARAHMDEDDKKSATIYKVIVHDISVVIIGHVFEDITDDEVEELGHVDIMFVPVGNKGYTLDGKGALKVIRKLEPKIVIPTHYADKSLKYEVAQDELAEALKLLEMEPVDTVPKLKLKLSEIPENLQLIVLEKQ